MADHYRKSKEKYVDRSRSRRDVLNRRVQAIKESQPCKDCGGRFPAVCMDFDHLGDNKEDNVASLVSHRVAWERIVEEIKKCELVCANCHRIRTANRQSELVRSVNELREDFGAVLSVP